MQTILSAILFFLPAGLANMAPVLANKIPVIKKWKTPLDFNKKIGKLPIFGANKTWRGLLAGVLLAALCVLLQKFMYKNNVWFAQHSLVDYSLQKAWLLGPSLAIGALLGDAFESFLKRRVGVKPGDSWFPFDQIDYIIGGLLASTTVIILPAEAYFYILVAYFGLHILVSYIGYLLGLKSKPI